MTEDNSSGSQHALQIALQTLKERCHDLQDRLGRLEDENISLRVKCTLVESRDCSLNEIDELKMKICKLTEQKAKLKRNIVVVVNENKQLWNRLSNLTQANRSLGSQLTKINDSLTQHNMHSPKIIRSNTFTHTDSTRSKTICNKDIVNLDLQEISLALISNIAKEKSELEAQCSDMTELQGPSSTSLGFSFLSSNGESDSLTESFDKHVSDLKTIRDKLLENNERCRRNLEEINEVIVNSRCKSCKEKENEGRNTQTNFDNGKDPTEEELQLESLAKWGSAENSNVFLQELSERQLSVCPMCGKMFNRDENATFVQHVENHFVEDI